MPGHELGQKNSGRSRVGQFCALDRQPSRCRSLHLTAPMCAPRFEKMAIIFISAVRVTDIDRLTGFEQGAVDARAGTAERRVTKHFQQLDKGAG